MWGQYGLFLAQTLTIVVAILATAAGIFFIIAKSKNLSMENVSIKHLNDRFNSLRCALQERILGKAALKTEKKEQKQREKDREKYKDDYKKIYVVNFQGDLRASSANNLREEITAILTVATPRDEVLVNVESRGGEVHSYGFAASQLQRIRDRGIPLTVSIDKVAASGGYMMACVADKIIAAPFAYVGSIGVILQFPNFHRFLQDKHIDFEQLKAGDLKRTVTMFGENTAKDREHCQEEIERVHQQFKTFVKRYRDAVDIEQVATGEVWLADKAKEFKLVDQLMTSDDYLLQAADKADIYEVKYCGKKSMMEKCFGHAKALIIDPLQDLLTQPR